MRNIKLVIQFDGTDFHGWQYQEGLRTVQGVLGGALERLTGAKITLFSSSRTDAGVHALAMPVNFEVDTNLPHKAFVLGTNSLLPPDLKVLEACDVPLGFNARFGARAKTYRYRVQNGVTALPLERRTAWNVRPPLDIQAMRHAASFLVGEHDFTSFRSVHCDARSPVRRIHSLNVEEAGRGMVVVEVTAGGFLRNMVRIIVGTLVTVGRGRRPARWVQDVLEARDRRAGGETAPPQGLFLVDVRYDDPLVSNGSGGDTVRSRG